MPMSASAGLLARLSTYYKDVDLSLRADYWRLLADLGDPHRALPPLIHIAGTNGKGSTIAFMRAMAEAAGLSVHVYTSPHLVHIHERIRLAGDLIEEDALLALLAEIATKLDDKKLTQFEIITAAAFLAFSRKPADLLLLETGMGGRLDATNIIPHALATVITRISHDHATYLGDDLAQIAGEKAGIFKKGCVAVVSPQQSEAVRELFIKQAFETGCDLLLHGRDWHHETTADGFRLFHAGNTYNLPPPSLLGAHQYDNAATAAVTLLAQEKFSFPCQAIQSGIIHAQWPARLQHLTRGPLLEKLSPHDELWLDGGHNDSAGEALAVQAQSWAADGKKLYLVHGMINTKNPAEFLAPLKNYVAGLAAVPVPDEEKSLTPVQIVHIAHELGLAPTWICGDAAQALICITAHGHGPSRILITGSLYLAGHILRDHG